MGYAATIWPPEEAYIYIDTYPKLLWGSETGGSGSHLALKGISNLQVLLQDIQQDP